MFHLPPLVLFLNEGNSYNISLFHYKTAFLAFWQSQLWQSVGVTLSPLQFWALLSVISQNRDKGKEVSKQEGNEWDRTQATPDKWKKSKILPLPTNQREIYSGNSKFLLE